MKKIISLLLVFTFGLSSCEKDDICDANTPTTPRLVISFYKELEPTVQQNVKDLRVTGEGQSESIIFNKNATGDSRFVTNANTVSIPLRTDKTTTTYTFEYNSMSTTPANRNKDLITIDYTTQNVYVSRACGFKTTFTLLPVNPIKQTDSGNDLLWMKKIFVKTPNIETENETHLLVFF